MSDDKRHYRTYFSSNSLRGVDLPTTGKTFRITAEETGLTEDEKTHCILTIRDAETTGIKWVTNITNCEFMTQIFGSPSPVDWVGHRITIKNDPTVKIGKRTVGGIRVMGSPEMTEPVRFEFQENSRKKARQVTLVPTGTATPPATVDPVTGEVDDDIGFTDDAPHADIGQGDTGTGLEDDAEQDGSTDALDGQIPGMDAAEVKARNARGKA